MLIKKKKEKKKNIISTIVYEFLKATLKLRLRYNRSRI